MHGGGEGRTERGGGTGTLRGEQEEKDVLLGGDGEGGGRFLSPLSLSFLSVVLAVSRLSSSSGYPVLPALPPRCPHTAAHREHTHCTVPLRSLQPSSEREMGAVTLRTAPGNPTHGQAGLSANGEGGACGGRSTSARNSVRHARVPGRQS